MRTFRQRALVVGLVTVMGTACGAAAGYLLGRVVTLKQTQARIERYAESKADEMSTAVRESRSVLAAMNSSPYAFCSDAEVGYFRGLIFQSHYLKDGGRIRDGKIDCSSTLGASLNNQAQFQPDFAQRDGALVYLNLPLFRIADRTVIAVQLGDSFVVYNPYVSSSLAPAHMHTTASDVDAATQATGRLFGEHPQVQGSILTSDGQVQLGNNMYATRCTTVGTACVTAYMSVPEALDASRGALAVFGTMGALAGGLLGLLLSLVYRRKQSLQNQLLRAIRRDALRVVYQPIVDLENGRIVEAEALVRWTDDDNRAIGPDEFVKVAEDRGFVGEITKLVVRHVLSDLGSTLRQRPDFRVNVNIAAADLGDAKFLPMLDEALTRADVRPESLAFEITESYTARQQAAKDTILQLRERGHSVYIDDFGTGYSSLAYLHDLSVDAIKIDKAFTQAIGTDAATVSILPQILSMASKLNLRVIVEGIETAEQARYFAEADESICAQGWLFGRPAPAEAIQQVLTENGGMSRTFVPDEQRAPVRVSAQVA